MVIKKPENFNNHLQRTENSNYFISLLIKSQATAKEWAEMDEIELILLKLQPFKNLVLRLLKHTSDITL